METKPITKSLNESTKLRIANEEIIGAEFFKITVDAKTNDEVIEVYNKVMETLLDEKVNDEVDDFLSVLILCEAGIDKNLIYENVLDLHRRGYEAEAVKVLKKYLIERQSNYLFAYTGTFLSADYGVNFLNQVFSSEKEAITYIEENHKKSEMPMGVKIKNSDKWVVAGWCSC